MRILIELPSWLGDAVMTSPAIENLINHFDDIEITLIGSKISNEVFKNHPNVIRAYTLDRKLLNVIKRLNEFDEFDFFFSFRNSLRAKMIKLLVPSKIKYQFNKSRYYSGHQVEKYNDFINDSLKINTNARNLLVHFEKDNSDKQNKLIGINPGAAYGDAKRWYPEKFAEVAAELSNQYDILIFGGPKEKNIAKDIENFLIKKGVNNFKNLATLISINELIHQISNLDLFITNDSGPMHLAAALQIPTVAIFGPTKDNETSQWMNEKSVVVKKDFTCQPCMKRVCPLNHHNCMKLVEASDVLDAVKKID